MKKMQESIRSVFSQVEDPRVVNRCKHKLIDILFIGFCTLLSNGDDFEDMVEFSEQRIDWLNQVLELPNGIPSHDTFNRVFQIIDSKQLRTVLGNQAIDLIGSVKDKLINFDGKKLRGVSPKSRGNNGLYILSAWVSENKICLGQTKVKDKSNEITAIPELIENLDLEGSTVSIDAIGCQKEIASKIIDAGANYLLSVKENQRNLYKEVSDNLTWVNVSQTSETWEYDHGRYEERKCSIIAVKEVLSPDILSEWKQVETLIRIESSRSLKGITSYETRFYISSNSGNAEQYNQMTRGHWSIENHLHWHLDVTFNEDASRSRTGNAPENLNIMRKLALQRISEQKDKLSLKKRRYRASMNLDYLSKVIGIDI